MSSMTPRASCISEQLVRVLLLHLPLNRDLVRLGASCSAAAAALQRHLAALRLDFSLGAEPQYPLAVQAPAPTSRQPPAPLDFTYNTAFELKAGGGVEMLADCGCDADCVCCSGDGYRGGDGDGDGGDGGGGGNAGLEGDDSDQKIQRRRDGAGGGVAGPSRRCSCGVAVPGGQPAYDPRVGGLRPALRPGASAGGASFAFILECGPACACTCAHAAPIRRTSGIAQHRQPRGQAAGAEAALGTSGARLCPARLTQRGLAVRVALRWLPDKGWGVVAREPIPAGRFVCLYGGEYVTTAEAEARLRAYDAGRQGHALLVVREVLPSGLALRINIDATSTGNAARFFNHSCDGGSMALLVVRRRGSFMPAVALFTSRDVTAGEELTFAYGPPTRGRRSDCASAKADSGSGAGESRPCRCGTSACLGYLPSEAV